MKYLEKNHFLYFTWNYTNIVSEIWDLTIPGIYLRLKFRICFENLGFKICICYENLGRKIGICFENLGYTVRFVFENLWFGIHSRKIRDLGSLDRRLPTPGARPSDKRKRKEEKSRAEDPQPSSKRARNDAEEQKDKIEELAQKIVPELTLNNVIKLVIDSMKMVPDTIPASFSATYTPIDSAGTESLLFFVFSFIFNNFRKFMLKNWLKRLPGGL